MGPSEKALPDVLEVGVIYTKGSRLFLAVAPDRAITFRQGRLVESRLEAPLVTLRGLSVEELCARWKIDLNVLDTVAAQYLAPSAAGIKPAPRGSRRDTASEQHSWRAMRKAFL